MLKRRTIEELTEGLVKPYAEETLEDCTLSELVLMIMNPFDREDRKLSSVQKVRVEKQIGLRYIAGVAALDYFRTKLARQVFLSSGWLKNEPLLLAENYPALLTQIGANYPVIGLKDLKKAFSRKNIGRAGREIQTLQRSIPDTLRKIKGGGHLHSTLSAIPFRSFYWATTPFPKGEGLVEVSERLKRLDRGYYKIVSQLTKFLTLFEKYSRAKSSELEHYENKMEDALNAAAVSDWFGLRLSFLAKGLEGHVLQSNLGGSKNHEIVSAEVSRVAAAFPELKTVSPDDHYRHSRKPNQIQVTYEADSSVLENHYYDVVDHEFLLPLPPAIFEVLFTDALSWRMAEFNPASVDRVFDTAEGKTPTLAHWAYDLKRETSFEALKGKARELYERCRGRSKEPFKYVDDVLDGIRLDHGAVLRHYEDIAVSQ